MKISLSIRQKIIVMLFVFVLLVLLLSYAANFIVVKEYYNFYKANSFSTIVNKIDEIGKNKSLSEKDKYNLLFGICETNDITLYVCNTEGDVVFNYGNDEVSQDRLECVRGKRIDNCYKKEILGEDDNYKLQMYQADKDSNSYYEAWGEFDNGYGFIIRALYQQQPDNSVLSNRVYYVTTIMLVVLISFMLYMFTTTFTKPIRDLSDISKKMVDDDFEAKYTGGKRSDEIDILGNNMNEMAEKLKNTIAELKSANLELQKDIDEKNVLDEQRKDFLSNVSHELKTPIALIQGYAEGLKEGINDDPESMEFYCDVIIDESKKMNNIVKKLLSLNQIEFGNYHVQMERFDIIQVIKGIVISSDILLKQKNVQLFFDDSESVYVWGDEFQIEEVLNNFISNAIHHVCNKNEIHITVDTFDDQVARINVFNTGNPIPEEELNSLWDKFYKVDKARTREYGGSGLGLSIVKAIMESMNQKYGVENIDDGVNFWFELERKN